MTRTLSYIIFSVALLCSYPLYAQRSPVAVERAVTNRVTFEDDFSNESTGAFPSKWIADSGNQGYCHIIIDGGNKVLSSNHRDSCALISPRLNQEDLRSDSLSIALDFYFEKKDAGLSLSFGPNHRLSDVHLLFENKGDEGLLIHYYSFKSRNFPWGEKKVQMVGTGRWHHIKVTFYNGAIKLLIDGRVEVSFPDAHCYPARFWMHLCHGTRADNVKINAVQGRYDLTGIVAGSGIVTHALQFDVNQSTIKNEHIGFLVRLIDFLNDNPTLNLEIAGHTDSDGDAAANLKLSQARAEAIKAYLVSEGINVSRLKAKGFGAAKPLQPNTTTENKANNRRVEFKKL